MAVTLGQLAVALRLQTSPTATPSDAYESILERLLAVGGALVETFGASAPEAIKDEATVRVAAYLFDQPNAGIRANYGAAWSNSGAAALVAPWSSRRAMPLAAGTPAAAGAGVDEAAVNRLIAAYVAAWAAADSTAPVPTGRLEDGVQHAVDQVPKLTTLVEDIELDENRTWRQTLDADGKFTWSRSRPADAAAAAALPDYANSRQNQPAVDAVDPALAFYWLTARIPAERSIADYRYRQHQGGHHGFIYDATGHDLGEAGGFHYWSVQFLLLSGNSTSFEYDELESTSTTYAGKLADGIVTLASLAAEVTAAISAGGGGGALLDGSVTTAKLANNAVTTAKLASGAVSTTKLAGVVRERLAPTLSGGTAGQLIRLNAAGTALEYVDPPSGTGGAPPNNSVGTLQLQDLAVTSAKIAADAISGPKIAADAVGAAELADMAVGFSALATAIRARIAPPLTDGTAGQILALNDDRTAVDWVNAPAGTGGDVIPGPGTVTTASIVNGAVTNPKLGDHSVNNIKLALEVSRRMAPLSAAGTGHIGGTAGQILALNAAGNAIEFINAPSGGGGGGGGGRTITDLYEDGASDTGTLFGPQTGRLNHWLTLGIGSEITALTSGDLEFTIWLLAETSQAFFGTAGRSSDVGYIRCRVADFKALPILSSREFPGNGESRYFTGFQTRLWLSLIGNQNETTMMFRIGRFTGNDVLVAAYQSGSDVQGDDFAYMSNRFKFRASHIAYG